MSISWDSEHKIKWNNSSILLKEVETKKIKIKETACIMLNNDNCIATSLKKIKPLWLPILKDDLDIGILQVLTIKNILVLSCDICQN